MRCTILLATLLLVATAKSQSNKESQSTETEEENSTLESKDSNETSVEVVVLQPSDSTDRFTFTEADAKSKKQKLQNEEGNALGADGDDGDAADVDAELDLLETLLTDSEKFFSEFPDQSLDSNDNDTTKNGENVIISSGTAEPTLEPKAEEIQIRRSGDLNPDLVQNNSPNVDFSQPRQDTSNPSLIDPNYIRTTVQSSASDSDNTPILTQGGYQRPYQRRGRFNGQLQRVRTGSASQQSATVETPLGRQNIGDQSRQPQITPQVSYANSYQPPFSYGAGPVLRQPFGYGGGFMNPNSPMPANAQNAFFNAPTNGFGDFMAPNFQAQYPQAGDSRFLNAPRDQSVISLFQAPPGHMLPNNPDLIFQNPFQLSPVQQVSNDPSRPVNTLYSPGSFSNYPSMNNVEDVSKPDYSAFFRNPSPLNSQFQANPNFYATFPNPSTNDFNNPTISLMPNYPTSGNGSPLSSRYVRYSTPDGQKMVKNTDQQVEKQKGSDTPDGETKEKDFEQIKVSPNKEEPLLVPFGARIQRQEDPNQDFSGQRDVYIRYPMREAGYATEENLPIQNTTQRSMGSNDIPQRQPFPYFTLPRQFPGYSSPDPYRNALNAVQQGFSTTINSKSDDSNKTREALPEEQIVPFPFDQNLPQPQSPVFTSYPDRNHDLTDLQSTPFYPAPGMETIRNPFAPLTQDALAVFPESRYPFPTSDPNGDTEKPDKIPTCAQKTNASMCFDDPEYPRREVLYALNSDSFLMERLVMPDQQLDGISLVEQSTSENPESTDNYICKSDIKTGMPLRAKNIEGKWKVIVNTERAIGRGVFKQPVRLEVCRGASEPCSYTQIKTACVQKYSLQRLLSWNREKGVHNDVFKLPVACSCQIVDKQK